MKPPSAMGEERLTVLQVVTLSEWGGAQEVVRLLSDYLRGQYRVLVACAPGGRLIDELEALGVPVIPIRHLVRYPHPFLDLFALFALWRMMRTVRPTVVHAHSTKAGMLARIAARLAGVPVVLFTAHGWSFTAGRSRWKRALLAASERLLARMTTRIICVSQHDRDLALQYRVAPTEKLVVIHNGLDPAGFIGYRVNEDMTASVGTIEPVVTFVGRLRAPKDPFTLIRAFSKLGCGRLVIVGDGPQRRKLHELVDELNVAKRVELIGERSDVPDLLATSDIFVLTSNWEGLPLTIIEAMMTGLPVVATSVGGVPELVEDGVTGFLVPREDSEALAEVFQKLLKDPELRRRMGQAGREKAARDFTLERMLYATKKMYEEVVGGVSE